MKKKVLLPILLSVLLGLLAVAVSIAQSHYQVKTLNSIEFLIPPYANLKIGPDGSIPKRFHIQHIFITGLSGDYYTSLAALNHAVYQHLRANGSPAATETPNSQNLKNNYGTIYHNSTSLWIYIDYVQLLTPKLSEDSLIQRYLDLAADLTAKIASAGAGKWPQGIAQKIVQQIFALIPIPQKVSLKRFCYAQNPNDTFILLDPSFKLEIDQSEKVEKLVGNVKQFYYDWQGIKQLSYTRSSSGKIIQNGFAYFPESRLPDNKIDDQNIYQLSSFADIQNSNVLKNKEFIALYHPAMKRNNKPKSGEGLYATVPNADEDWLTGNAFLVHLDAGELDMLHLDHPGFKKSDTFIKSIFGYRNSIGILITVFVNGIPRDIPFGTTPIELSDFLPNAKLRRVYQDSYEKVKGDISKVFLLPNDRLNY